MVFRNHLKQHDLPVKTSVLVEALSLVGNSRGLMMKIASLIMTMLIGSAFIASQENQITQAERIVLDTPAVISLKLSPLLQPVSEGVNKPLSGPFTTETKIKLSLVAINTTLIPLVVKRWDPYGQNCPLLLRDNQEVAYRAGLMDRLKSKDNDTGDVVSLELITLEPNREKIVEDLDLSYWYEPLEPGHYVLSTRHRFVQGGKWADAASVTFEVERKKTIR
jgi:hypothetical protein